MDETGGYILPKSSTALGGLAQTGDRQSGLFPERISVIHAYRPNGANIAFYCTVENGDRYYAKNDSFGHPVRATEYFLTTIARELGLNVPEIAILEDDLGETYFGSKDLCSTAALVDARELLTKKSTNELGQPDVIGQFLSRLSAFDHFFLNDDRALQNFLLTKDGLRKNLYAMDFTNSDLLATTSQRILLETSATVRAERLLRNWHGFDLSAAINLVENIGRLDQRFIEQTLDAIPEDWLDAAKRKSICESWSDGNIQTRIEALKSFFVDGKTI